MRAVMLSAAIALALTACGGDSDNYLEGSMAESFDLAFDSVRVRLYTSELAVEYVVESDEGEKVALRVTLSRTASTALAVGGSYDMAVMGTIGRGSGFTADLPPMESGTTTLTTYGEEDGAACSGTFESVFAMTDGSKKTLRGGFAGPLEVVTF